MSKYTDEALAEIEKKMAKEYRKCAKTTQRIIEKRIAEFEEKNRNKLQDLANGTIDEDEYSEWYDKELHQGEWVDKAAKEGAKEQTKANVATMLILAAALIPVFRENINYETYRVERHLGFGTGWKTKTDRDIKRIIKKSPSLMPSRKMDIPKDRRWNERAIRRELLRGMRQGESINKIAKRLQRAGMVSVTTKDIKDRHLKSAEQIAKEVARKNNVAAVRNARTMCNCVQNAAKLEAYRRMERLGMKIKKVWSATMDDRTRDSHAFLDGVRVGLEEEFPNGCMYPADASGPADEVWNCRCELGFDEEGRERDWADLSQRNTDHFNYDSYEEWKEAHR